MSERLRAVLDTNVFVTALLSRNPNSPARELLERWQRDEFTLVTCDALIDEIAEKLIERQIAEDKILELLARLALLAEWTEVPASAITPVVVRDPDDDVLLACALLGRADYLVTHDADFEPLGGEYQGVKIVETLPFLWAVRGDQPPERK